MEFQQEVFLRDLMGLVEKLIRINISQAELFFQRLFFWIKLSLLVPQPLLLIPVNSPVKVLPNKVVAV